MKAALLCGAMGACLLLAGCDDSKNPLSDPPKAKADTRLTGVWKKAPEKDGDVQYWHFGRAGGKLPEGMMRVVGVQHLKDGTVKPSGDWLLFAADLQGSTYLNVVLSKNAQAEARMIGNGWQPELVQSYWLWKYRLEGDSLLVWAMDPNAKKQAIESGKIKGMIKLDDAKKRPERVLFTDTTENVARLVAAEGDKLFAKEPMRFERVK